MAIEMYADGDTMVARHTFCNQDFECTLFSFWFRHRQHHLIVESTFEVILLLLTHLPLV